MLGQEGFAMPTMLTVPLVLLLSTASPAEPPLESYLRPVLGAPAADFGGPAVEIAPGAMFLRMQPRDVETLRYGLAGESKGRAVGEPSWRSEVRLVVLRGREPLPPHNEEMRPDFLAERIAAIDRRGVPEALTIMQPHPVPEAGAIEPLSAEATLSLSEPGEYLAYLFVPPGCLPGRMSPAARINGALSDPILIRVESDWTPAERAARHYRQAARHIDRDNILGLKEIDLAIAAAPQVGEYHLLRGLLLFRLDHRSDAREAFGVALKLYRQRSIADPYHGW